MQCNCPTLFKYTQATNSQSGTSWLQMHIFRLEKKTGMRIKSVDIYLKRQVCLCVFDCLTGNVCTPFKNYFTRVSDSVNPRKRFSLIELPKMNWEFGRRRFSFLGASVFNRFSVGNLDSWLLFSQKANEHSYLLFLFIRFQMFFSPKFCLFNFQNLCIFVCLIFKILHEPYDNGTFKY